MKRRLLAFLRRCTITPSSSGHFDFLDGLRGIAIMFVVVLCHGFYLKGATDLPSRIASTMLTAGEMGVPVFFVLSGFVIALPFFKVRKREPRAWKVPGYAIRRLAKIVPPFALSIAVFGAFYCVRDGNLVLAREGLKWLCGAASFCSFPYRFNPVYWSLIGEVQFYCVLPFLFLATRGCSVKRTAVVCFWVLLLVPMMTRLVVRLGSGEAVTVPTALFPFSLDFFAWGVLFAGYYAAGDCTTERGAKLARLGYLGVGGLLLYFWVFALLYVAPFFGQHEYLRTEIKHLFPAVASMLALFFVYNPSTPGSRVLCAPFLKFAGVVSYEWYLFHLPISNGIRVLVGHTHDHALLYLAKTAFPMALTLALAAVIYRVFSLPILEWGRAQTRDRRQLAAAAAGATSPIPAAEAAPAVSAGADGASPHCP
jgi:peptidoglycan/LPS O-acetylase OafA/YrhL